ncbi:hypothetical protein ACFZCY_33435 [Streptomyces sp. NPDC007983]|uniref:hypothetical protein n=1 Tax=Streptomyces sp. NPDC007983 TaxID=3364800 RepID=UPI0036EC5A2B
MASGRAVAATAHVSALPRPGPTPHGYDVVRTVIATTPAALRALARAAKGGRIDHLFR